MNLANRKGNYAEEKHVAIRGVNQVHRMCPECGITMAVWTEEEYRLHRHECEDQWDRTLEKHCMKYHPKLTRVYVPAIG